MVAQPGQHHDPAPMIRDASLFDVEAVARVYVETWQSAYAGILPKHALVSMSVRGEVRAWARQIVGRRVNGRILVAEGSNGEIVGVGSCGPCRVGGLTDAGEVYTLYVRPDDQGHGLGRALLCRLFKGIEASGWSAAVVGVLAENPSRFFYEAMGGKIVASYDKRLWGMMLRHVIYGWTDTARVGRRSRSSA